MAMKTCISAALVSILVGGCVFSETSEKNEMVGEWDQVVYEARYFENNDTSLSRPLSEGEWKYINHIPRWYSNIQFIEFENSTFKMEHIDSSEVDSVKVVKHEGEYKIMEGKLWLIFNGSPDSYATSTGYPPFEIGSDSIVYHLCFQNFTGSDLNLFVPAYGKCPPSSGYVVPPKNSIEVAVSLRKSIP